MNARKMPSGRWQSVVYVGKENGKKIFKTVTEDSKRACLLKAAQIKGEQIASPNITVGEAVEKYIATKKGVLSPSTVAGYRALQRRYLSDSLISLVRLDHLDDQKVQEWISGLSENVSKKTVLNAYGLLSSSVKMFAPKMSISVRFPQGKRYDGYVPATEEVFVILRAAKEYDERLYRAVLLAAFAGLRRGEISCLTAEDISGNVLHVTKDVVKDQYGKWITKLPKTEASVRDVPLHDFVVEEMPKEGRLVDYRPDEITKWFGKIVKKSGLLHFRFHDLRKHAVSLMAAQGVSMASIKDVGGWSNIQTPQRIYVKALADAKKREMENYIAFVGSLLTKL